MVKPLSGDVSYGSFRSVLAYPPHLRFGGDSGNAGVSRPDTTNPRPANWLSICSRGCLRRQPPSRARATAPSVGATARAPQLFAAFASGHDDPQTVDSP